VCSALLKWQFFHSPHFRTPNLKASGTKYWDMTEGTWISQGVFLRPRQDLGTTQQLLLVANPSRQCDLCGLLINLAQCAVLKLPTRPSLNPVSLLRYEWYLHRLHTPVVLLHENPQTKSHAAIGGREQTSRCASRTEQSATHWQ